MGRLAKKAAEAEQRYDHLPAEWRDRFEKAIASALEGLSMVEELKQLDPGLGELGMDLVVMTFTEGKIAGNWPKVHAEIATGSARLYRVVGSRLPKNDNGGL